MTNAILNTATAATSTPVATSNEVANLLSEGQKKTQEFVLVLSGITLMSDTVTLSSLEDNKLQGQLKDDVSGNRIKVSTKTSIFGEPIARLKGIKKKVEAVLSTFGSKAEIDGGYFVPKTLATQCLEQILPLKEEFKKEMEDLKKEYSVFFEAEKNRCMQIEDVDLRAEAMGKLPTFENFSKRCQFKPVVLDWAPTNSENDAVNALLDEGKADKSASIIENYLDKVFSPFYMVKYDFDNNVKNRADYKAEEVGKKRGSIRKACQKALNTRFCMEQVFKDEPEKTLLEKAFAIIEQISTRFCGKESERLANPSEEISKRMYEVYLNILNTMSSKESFEEFLSKGSDIESILKGFDLKNAKKGIISISKEESLENINNALAELKGEPLPAKSEEQANLNDEDFISSLEELADASVASVVSADTEVTSTEQEIVHNVQSDSSVQEESSETEEEVIPSLTIDPNMDSEDFYASLGL